jgi:hypothetical protein
LLTRERHERLALAARRPLRVEPAAGRPPRLVPAAALLLALVRRSSAPVRQAV